MFVGMHTKVANEDLGRLSLEEFQNKKKWPIWLVLDNVRSLHNVGSVFRTADAFCIEGILLCGITGTPPHREIQKTALGATESVFWKYFSSTLEAIDFLKQKQVLCYALEQTQNSTNLDQFKPAFHSPIALVFGHEVEGVSQAVINACDGVIEIPQFGTKHSFNISVSAGIVLWQVYLSLK